MATTSKAFLGAGKVYLDRLTDAGASTGFLDTAEVGTLEISESTELKTMTSKSHESYGTTIASVSVKQPAALKLSLKEIDVDNMALALLGTVAAYTQTGGTVAAGAEAVTLIPGKWVKLANENITAHEAAVSEIVIGTDADPVVSVPLTDVELNLRLGLIKYTGSSLTEATDCTIGYTYGTVTGSRISGSVQPQVKFKVLFDGRNLVTGEYVKVEIDEAICTPSSPVDFMNDDFAELEMEGEMRVVDGQTAPYRVTYI